jgi:hypothetical protein
MIYRLQYFCKYVRYLLNLQYTLSLQSQAYTSDIISHHDIVHWRYSLVRWLYLPVLKQAIQTCSFHCDFGSVISRMTYHSNLALRFIIDGS